MKDMRPAPTGLAHENAKLPNEPNFPQAASAARSLGKVGHATAKTADVEYRRTVIGFRGE